MAEAASLSQGLPSPQHDTIEVQRRTILCKSHYHHKEEYIVKEKVKAEKRKNIINTFLRVSTSSYHDVE